MALLLRVELSGRRKHLIANLIDKAPGLVQHQLIAGFPAGYQVGALEAVFKQLALAILLANPAADTKLPTLLRRLGDDLIAVILHRLGGYHACRLGITTTQQPAQKLLEHRPAP